MGRPLSFTPQAGDSPKIKSKRTAVGRHYSKTRFRSAADIPQNRKERRAAVKLDRYATAKLNRKGNVDE
jgi:hypothetical protein